MNETVDEILPVFAQVNSLNFEFYFLSFLWEMVFSVTSGNYLICI